MILVDHYYISCIWGFATPDLVSTFGFVRFGYRKRKTIGKLITCSIS